MQDIVIRTGKEHMDVMAVHQFLSESSYWARGISFELVNNSLSNSFCVGAFLDGVQIGFGRVITDYATFGWLADFWVSPAHQGKGVAKKMLLEVLQQDWAKRLRRIMLNTSDAHGLYHQFGFKALNSPANILEVYRPDVHLQIPG